MHETVQANPNQGYIAPGVKRRVIGPVCPRDASGKFKLPPIPAKRAKMNILGEPLRNKDGQPIEEEYDTRSEIEYRLWEPGQHIPEEATRGLSLFRVDYDPEPSMLVYAKNEQDAVKVYQSEMGISRCSERDPKASLANAVKK